jgi:hypothetical protein
VHVVRRAFVVICAVVLALVGVAQAQTQQQAGLAAARHDAQQLLGRVRLPANVARLNAALHIWSGLEACKSTGER